VATETVGQEQELRSEALTIQQKSAIKIVNQETYNQAADALRQVKGFRNRWKSYWEPLRENAYSSYKAIMDKIKEGDDPLAQAERSLKNSILDWDEAQRREQERLQAEAQRKAEADEEARRAQEAFELEESGATDEQIEAVTSAPIIAVAPPVSTYVKASGIAYRDNWCIEIVDLFKVLRLIGSKKLKLGETDVQKLRELLESILKPRAVSDKETLSLDGCKAVNRKVVAGRMD
jgi:gas vesicle protein